MMSQSYILVIEVQCVVALPASGRRNESRFVNVLDEPAPGEYEVNLDTSQ